MRKFWFTLALALGMTVREAQEKISSAEFSEWMAFNRLDLIGNERGDLRTGIVAATIASSSGKKNYKPADFMPRFGSRNRQMTVEEMEARVRIAAPPIRGK